MKRRNLMDEYAKLQAENLKDCGKEYIIWSVIMDIFSNSGLRAHRDEVLMKKIEELEEKKLVAA